MRQRIIIFFLTIIFFHSASGYSLGRAVPDTLPTRDTTAVKKRGAVRFVNNVVGLFKDKKYIIAPEFARKPETGFLTGIYYLQLINLFPKTDSVTRTSNVETYFDYTERHQIIVSVKNNLNFKKEKFLLNGENQYTKFPDNFWGIGNKTKAEWEEFISYEMLNITQRFVTRVHGRFYTGIQYQFVKISAVEHKAGGLMDTMYVPGSHGSRTSGPGFVFLYDSRDNVLNSFKGFYFNFNSVFNDKFFGSQYNYTNMSIDMRKFFHFGGRRVLALQGVMNYNYGEVPFRQLANMGGDMIMRGYYYGRFRDKVMLAAQAEFRFDVYKAIGLTVFGSVAEVAPTFQAMDIAEIRYTFGMCFRLMLNKKERLNIGIDTGFGDNTSGLYFNSGEAF